MAKPELAVVLTTHWKKHGVEDFVEVGEVFHKVGWHGHAVNRAFSGDGWALRCGIVITDITGATIVDRKILGDYFRPCRRCWRPDRG